MGSRLGTAQQRARGRWLADSTQYNTLPKLPTWLTINILGSRPTSSTPPGRGTFGMCNPLLRIVRSRAREACASKRNFLFASAQAWVGHGRGGWVLVGSDGADDGFSAAVMPTAKLSLSLCPAPAWPFPRTWLEPVDEMCCLGLPSSARPKSASRVLLRPLVPTPPKSPGAQRTNGLGGPGNLRLYQSSDTDRLFGGAAFLTGVFVKVIQDIPHGDSGAREASVGVQDKEPFLGGLRLHSPRRPILACDSFFFFSFLLSAAHQNNDSGGSVTGRKTPDGPAQLSRPLGQSLGELEKFPFGRESTP